MIAEYRRTGDPRLREAAILRQEGLVHSVAHRYARPEVPAEDLAQVAWMALIRAVDRFDPSYGTRFSTYAVHCMTGEIKRYFRDRTWSIKAPRRLQDVAIRLPHARNRLFSRLGREPTAAEMAREFEISEHELRQAEELSAAYHPRSLRERRANGEGSESRSLAEQIGAPDPETEALVEYAPLHRALDRLEPRDRRILRMRFWEGRSQQEVADRLDYSQMHVSRLERKAIRKLRGLMSGG